MTDRPTTTAARTRPNGDGPTGGTAARLSRLVGVAAGALFVAAGLWAFAAPAAFFDAAATFEPYNPHLIRDIGAFQIGLGAVLLLAASVRDGLVAALAGVGVGAAFHFLGHVVDRDLGGTPALDLPAFALVAVVLITAAVVRGMAARR